MKILKTLIKDFQSLSEIKLDHGNITVIYGQSDVGKSALIRSIYLLHRNVGSKSMVRHGKPYLQVFQKLESGDSIGVQKGNEVNKYYFRQNGLAEDKVYAKVGKEVPEDLQSYFGTGLLFLDKDQSLDLNFSLQFDAPFLLVDSQATVTKAVSSVSGINIIYAAIRESQAQSITLRHGLSKVQALVDNLDKFNELGLEVSSLNQLFSKLKALDAGVALLDSSLLEFNNLYNSIGFLTLKSVDLSDLDALFKAIIDLSSSLTMEVASNNELIDLKAKFDSCLAKNFDDLTVIGNYFSSINELATKYTDTAEQLLIFKSFYDSTQAASLNITKIENELQLLIEEEADFKSRIKLCPACGKPL